MSRSNLIAAAESRPGGTAVAPLIGLHAARLEQIEPQLFLTDAHSQVRALSNAQRLYDTDAVTIGAWLDTFAVAARLAERSGDNVIATRADATPLAAPPDPEAVLAKAVVQAEITAIRFLRSLLGERAAIAMALPTPGRLESQVGANVGRSWCSGLLMRVLRMIGEEEPDLLILVGEDDPGPRIAALCQHFNLHLLVLGPELPAGVAVTPGDRFVCMAPGARLYTTTSELPPESDPRQVKATINDLRGQVTMGKNREGTS